MTFQQAIQLHTVRNGQMHDISQQVNDVVRQSGVQTGIAHVFNVGSTAIVGTIEFEPGLVGDLPAALNRLLPPSRDYGHEQALA